MFTKSLRFLLLVLLDSKNLTPSSHKALKDSFSGLFKVVRVVKKPIKELWKIVNKKAGVTYEEFNAYYEGISVGVAIFFAEVRKHPKPIELKDLKKKVLGFFPPQGFRYTNRKELISPQLAKSFR